MSHRIRFAPDQRICLITWLLFFVAADCRARSLQARPSRPVNSQAARAALTPEVRARVGQAMLSVGLILVSDQPFVAPRPRGSAVAISADGLVVTNYHVITHDDQSKEFRELYLSLPADNAALAPGAPRYRLRKLAIDKLHDLALLQAEPVPRAGDTGTAAVALAWPALRIGPANAVQTLDDLFVIGYPVTGGATVTFSTGVVEGLDSNGEWIKTDARLLHGNSGGAAVNTAGVLVGIATRVETDQSREHGVLGAVGFLRPAYLVTELVKRWQTQSNTATHQHNEKKDATTASRLSPPPLKANEKPAEKLVIVRGTVKVAGTNAPVAGARVGLILAGREVAPETVIAFGGTNAEGEFQLEKPVPPGRYTLRARVIEDNRYEIFNQPIEIKAGNAPLVIEMRLR